MNVKDADIKPSNSESSAAADVATKPKGKKLQVQLPYLPTPGTIKTAFEKIRQAATPDRFTPDFVSTKLQMKGGTGASVAPFLKKIGLVGSDAAPTDLYKQFRNTSTGGAAIASAIKHGYKALSAVNEYFYELSDKELQSLIVQVTGTEPNSSSSKQIFYTLKALKEYADFEASPTAKDLGVIVSQAEQGQTASHDASKRSEESPIGLNLAYTINLNLPATSDQSVFNAIFRSLKEHLLSNGD